MSAVFRCEHLVIGSGLAGLAFALKTVEKPSFDGKVFIVTKDSVKSANTPYAQGGIAAVMGEDDSFESHIQDTLTAGAGLCKIDVVKDYIKQAPERINDLSNWGVHFDIQDTGEKFDLTREGGHHHRRVLHVKDHTGADIHQALLEQCRRHPHIEIFENHFAIDLILNRQVDPTEMGPARCVGAYVLNRATSEVVVFLGKSTILSTGGAGKVYLYTANWSGATGDGIAMAHRAGARVSNLEFMQFHPTCLYHPQSRNFLISEALRGEGGELVLQDGTAFMKKYHEMGSLAPRDIVARSIDAEMKKTGAPCVYLDMTKHSRDYLQERFPVIFQMCLKYDIDMSSKPIPVVPAAHYLCGGVLADKSGRTDVQSLWAIGETACTGFHGANRLASNSLLECLAMAYNCAEAHGTRDHEHYHVTREPKPWIHPIERDSDEMIVIHHMWDEIRTLMWNYVGIVRSDKRLQRASVRLQNILTEIKDYYSQLQIHSDILELRNIAVVAELTVQSALWRKESRGIHYNIDYPKTSAYGRDSIL